MIPDYEAIVSEDFMRGTVRLRVLHNYGGGREVLTPDGLWRRVDDGVVSEDDGIAFRPEAIKAIAKACASFLGKQLPSEAEVAVLREWLAVEQRRVDAALEARQP